MSLILDALKRLEAKAPPRPPVARVVELPREEVNQASPIKLQEPSAPSVVEELPAPTHETQPQFDLREPVLLESVEVTVADPSPDDWFEQTEMCLTSLDLSDNDVDVQIAIGALEGDVRDLDLKIKALNEAEFLQAEPRAAVSDTLEEPQIEHLSVTLGEPDGSTADATTDELPVETIDFAAELAHLWDETTVEAADEAPANSTGPAADPPDDHQEASTISFGPLEDDLQLNPDLSIDAIGEPDEIAPEVTTDDEVAAEVAEAETFETDAVDVETADAEVPAGSILPITDFRPAIAELAPEELADDHDLLAAQLAELEYRGFRDNVISQLPDAPVALLFAAPDEDTDIVDVVVGLSNSLAQLKYGDVVIVCSKELRDSYRASPEYGDLYQSLTQSPRSSRRVPTLMIDPEDAGDRLIADLKRRCRWVLLAADPATARRWSPLCDATYVVVGLGNTDRGAAVKSVTALELSGGHVLGCVLTDVPDVA